VRDGRRRRQIIFAGAPTAGGGGLHLVPAARLVRLFPSGEAGSALACGEPSLFRRETRRAFCTRGAAQAAFVRPPERRRIVDGAPDLSRAPGAGQVAPAGRALGSEGERTRARYENVQTAHEGGAMRLCGCALGADQPLAGRAPIAAARPPLARRLSRRLRREALTRTRHAAANLRRVSTLRPSKWAAKRLYV
jgi:hypothetical protein